MNLRTELLTEIRILATTFKSGDPVAAWIAEATDEQMQSVLGSRVRTISPAISRIEDYVELQEVFAVTPDELEGLITDECDEADEDEAVEELDDDTEEADEDEDSVDPKRMAEKLKRARARYEPTVAYTGRLSSNTGDELSVFLAGMIPKDVCYLADLVCIDETGPIALFHWSKYEHLNPGSIRMNAGNKIRSRVKSGLVSLPQLRNLLKSEI